MDCISAGHEYADLWILVLLQINECVGEGINMSVVWTEARSTLEEKAKMSPGNRQVAWANEKAEELGKTGAMEDGAGEAEQIAFAPEHHR